jgi:hypothetical protein
MIKLPENMTHEEELRWIDHFRVQSGKKFMKLNSQLKHVRVVEFEVTVKPLKPMEKAKLWWQFWK